MMEIDMTLVLMANISFWICPFMDGFALGSWRLIIVPLAFIPLIAGWIFFFASSPNIIDCFTSATMSEWYAIVVFVIIILITSMGGGYLCGRFFRRDGK